MKTRVASLPAPRPLVDRGVAACRQRAASRSPEVVVEKESVNYGRRRFCMLCIHCSKCEHNSQATCELCAACRMCSLYGH